MKLILLVVLLAASRCRSSRVDAQTGQNVTLSCSYDFLQHGRLSACWGRGAIPSSGCGDLLVSTDGTRKSSRYQLLGRVDRGDVSLTILNASRSDAGQYGCRVDITGLFNDVKHHVHLNVEEAPPATTATATTASQTSVTETPPAAGQATSTETRLTSSSSGVQAEQEDGGLVLVLVCVLSGSVVSVTAGGLVLVVNRRRKLSKTPQRQQVASWVRSPLDSAAEYEVCRPQRQQVASWVRSPLDSAAEYEVCRPQRQQVASWVRSPLDSAAEYEVCP